MFSSTKSRYMLISFGFFLVVGMVMADTLLRTAALYRKGGRGKRPAVETTENRATPKSAPASGIQSRENPGDKAGGAVPAHRPAEHPGPTDARQTDWKAGVEPHHPPVDAGSIHRVGIVSMAGKAAATPDTHGPTIRYIIQDPNGDTVPTGTPIKICAAVSDPSGIARVVLLTDTDGKLQMVPAGFGTYRANLPSRNRQTVCYRILATDTQGNQSETATYRYTQDG